jgi:glycine cleavage system H lipoate-binding protein
VVNSDPHETWIIVLKLKEPSESNVLLDADQYAQFVGTLTA